MKSTAKYNVKVDRWLVHAVASCENCAFEESDYKKAQRKGREHFKKTGHKVTVETGYCQIYGD